MKFKKNEPTTLDIVIERLTSEMHDTDQSSKEYAQLADQLVKLYKLKETDSKMRVSPDTLAIIGANLLGILIIVGHERAHIITTKAIGFVSKLK